jgi:mannose-6-phosphate isomerase-like protein (cupin superfamily)
LGKDKEIISSNVKKNTILAIIVKRYKISNRIDVTSVNEILQASVLSLKKNNVVHAHKHNLVRRETYGTQEVWIVKKGRGLVSFYDLNDKFLCSKRITKGDIVLNLRGGHGLRPLSRKMVFIEIKNGPYKGSEIDKVSINS